MLAAFGLQHLLDGTGRQADADRRGRGGGASGARRASPPTRHGSATCPTGWSGCSAATTPATPDVTALASVLRWVPARRRGRGARGRARHGPGTRARSRAAAVALAALDLLAMGLGTTPRSPRREADPPAPPAVEAHAAAHRPTAACGGRQRPDPEHGLALGAARRPRPRAAGRRAHRAPLATARNDRRRHGRRGPRGPETVRLLDLFGVRAALLDRSR